MKRIILFLFTVFYSMHAFADTSPWVIVEGSGELIGLDSGNQSTPELIDNDII